MNRVMSLFLGTMVVSTPAVAWDEAESARVALERIDVMRIVFSPSTGTSTVTMLRGACPPETVSHTDSDFGPGQYVVQAGFAQDESAGASWVLPADRWPIKFDLAEILFATANATESTTTHWGIEIFQGTPGGGSVVASYQSDGTILPHLVMGPGTNGTIIQFLIDPDDPEQLFISENAQSAYSVAFRVIQHNQPGNPCISSPPSNANAFPTTDTSGLEAPSGNWIDMVTGPFCVCGQGWTTFATMPSLCQPSGDWVLRSTYTPYGCEPASGACCLPSGDCEVASTDACLVQGGTYQGDGTDCASANCPEPTGACCLESSGNCVDAEEDVCTGFGGVWHADTSCATWVCFPMGACCMPDGSCVDDVSPDACGGFGGAFQGHDTNCGTTVCPSPTGWCCTPSGDCFELEQDSCEDFGADWGGPGTTCDDPDACDANPCPADVDGSGEVGVNDVLDVIAHWEQAGDLPADVNGDGVVNVNDLLEVINAWGPCAG